MSATAAAAVDAGRPQVWLHSRRFDLYLLIGSAALVPLPLVMYHWLGVGQTAVNLIVAGIVGGPHLYSTFTYTVMEPNFRRRHKKFLLGSLVVPVVVTTLAFVNLSILITVFFTWASIHVLHQITYINDCYNAKRGHERPLFDKIIDYGVVFTCLYPIATPQILDGDFQLGGTELFVPDWATQGIIADAQIFMVFAVFGSFLVLWLRKTVREAREGTMHGPSVLLISLTIVIGSLLPLAPNIDVAFQGFNMWHSFQYLALVWYLNSLRAERGELTGFEARFNGREKPLQFYGLAVAITACAGLAVLAINATGVSLQTAYYIVILSTLLQHYYFDHLQFTKLGDALGDDRGRLLGP